MPSFTLGPPEEQRLPLVLRLTSRDGRASCVQEIIDSRQQSYEDIHRASISEIHDILSASQKLSQTPS